MDEQWWSKNFLSHSIEIWQGQTFELVCLLHTEAIKKKLGISGISTEISSWRYTPKDSTEKGAQVDMVISRADRTINLCEMKFAVGQYQITKEYAEKMRNRLELFRTKTKIKSSLVQIMVTTFGVASGVNSSVVQQEVIMDDLFA